MPNSLSSRFRGALWGMAIGDVLGANSAIRQRLNSAIATDRGSNGLEIDWLEINQWGFAPIDDPTARGWGQLVADQIRPFNSTDIGRLGLRPIEALPSSSPGLPSCDPLGLAIALLPTTLLYHDNLPHLPTALQQQTQHLPSSDWMPQWSATLSISAAIAQALQSQRPASPADFPPSAFSTAILPLFLSTPSDFSLLLRRVARLPHPQTACAIAGALSGAYNGHLAIPLDWCRALFSSHPAPLSLLWGIATPTELMELVDRLLAQWSGAYTVEQWLNQPAAQRLTASPGSIRPR